MKKKLMMIMLSALTLQAYAADDTKTAVKTAHEKSKSMEKHLKSKVQDAKEKSNEAKAKKDQSATNAKEMNKMLVALKKAHKMQALVTKHLANASK